MEQKELINWLKEAAEGAGEFVQREAPLVANEIVAWHYGQGVLCAVMFFSMSLATVVFWCIAYRSWESIKRKDLEPPFAMAIVVSILPFTIGLFFGGFGVADAVKAKLAPRVVIIEYIRGAAK